MKQNDWTEEVQKLLTIPPSSKGDVKKRRMEQNPAFDLLCQNASKWIQYLPDIQELKNDFDHKFSKYYFGKDKDEEEDEDEDEKLEKGRKLKQMQEEKQLLTEKAVRMIKIMGDIAIDIGIPPYTEVIPGILYDIVKGGIHTRSCGTHFYVKVPKDPSAAQLKLSLYAYTLAHPSAEELGINS